MIGDYTLTEIIGEGEFHEVRKAKKGRNEYAVKRIRYKVDQNDVKIVFDKTTQMDDHRNVIGLKDFFFMQGKPVMYLVMEYCNYKSLNDHIVDATVKPANKMGYILDLASGLNHLHTQKIIHGDVRPVKAIMAPGKERPICKLTDYGVSLVMEAKVKSPGIREIAEFYRAPEVAESKEFSTAGDIYSLAQTFFAIASEMQTQRDGKKLLVAAVKTNDGSAHTLNVVVESGQIQVCLDSRMTVKVLVNLMVKMLNKKPKDRPKADYVMCKAAEAQGEFNVSPADDIMKSKGGDGGAGLAKQLIAMQMLKDLLD